MYVLRIFLFCLLIYLVNICTKKVFNFYVSNTVVTPSAPSLVNLNFNCIKNFWYEHHLERKYPSFEPLVIFKIFVISFMFILLLFTIFLHLCNSVRYITITTNLTLNPKKKYISRLPQPSMTLVSLLLFGLLSSESTENYFSFLIMLPELDYGNMFWSLLKFRKILFQILFAILSIYIFYLPIAASAI